MKKILVLMSLYNGHLYLRQQLDSLLKQKGVHLSLLVRDDGSTDKTSYAILKEFSNRNIDITVLEGDNCGSARSFMALVDEAYNHYLDFDCFAFCDQDDVWLPEKLLTAVRQLEKTDGNMPCLYLGSYQMVDSNLNNIPTSQKAPKLDLVSAFVANPATGCTMVFNRQLLEEVATKQPKYMIMHDYWVYLVCLAVGGYVCYDKTPYLLYRQHGHNVIGGKKDPFLHKWIVRIKKIFKKGDRFKSRMATQLLNCYGNKMSLEDKSFLKQIVTCRCFSSKVKLLMNKQFRGKSMDKNLQLLGLIILGKL